jgi:uncharacterized membrane protein YeaQ/YmgE (transglycosylase-associated protein family)
LSMSILAWMALGLIAGFVASRLVNKTGESVVIYIALGIVGALAGGWLFNQFGQPGVTGLNLWSFIVAVAGSVVFLVLYHAVAGRAPRRV